jgi:hypothetical protein
MDNIRHKLDFQPKELILWTLDQNCEYYSHPLGFYYCSLDNNKQQGTKNRLHLWSPFCVEQEPRWRIHNHVFNLKSQVILGSITNIGYKLKQGNNHQIYEVIYQEQDSVLMKTQSKVDVSIAKESLFKQGMEYIVSANELHQSIPENNKLTICLCEMVQENFRTAPLVVGEISGKEKYIFKRESVAREHILKLVELV